MNQPDLQELHDLETEIKVKLPMALISIR